MGIAAAAAGWPWAGALIAFFVSSSALTRWRHVAKTERTERTLPRPAPRSSVQVAANGGLFVLLAFASTSFKSERLAFGALGALAAAAADTWSTEIGLAFDGAPRLLTTWKAVDPGMSGGVTVVGLLGGAAGALFIAVLGAFVIPQHRVQLAQAAFAGGLGGCVADSAVGATLQSRRFCDQCNQWTERRVHPCGYRTRHARGIYWMSNDVVNLCATLAGAVIAVTVGWALGR